jgi:hypothetical protein
VGEEDTYQRGGDAAEGTECGRRRRGEVSSHQLGAFGRASGRGREREICSVGGEAVPTCDREGIS